MLFSTLEKVSAKAAYLPKIYYNTLQERAHSSSWQGHIKMPVYLLL